MPGKNVMDLLSPGVIQYIDQRARHRDESGIECCACVCSGMSMKRLLSSFKGKTTLGFQMKALFRRPPLLPDI